MLRKVGCKSQLREDKMREPFSEDLRHLSAILVTIVHLTNHSFRLSRLLPAFLAATRLQYNTRPRLFITFAADLARNLSHQSLLRISGEPSNLPPSIRVQTYRWRGGSHLEDSAKIVRIHQGLSRSRCESSRRESSRSTTIRRTSKRRRR